MLKSFKTDDLVLGRYRLLEVIGRGGMADIYKAFDTVEEEHVALKVMSRYLAQDPRFKRRFERETRVLMELDHPNIVKLKEVGEQDGLTILVMPFMDTGSLSERLQRGPIKLREGAKIIDQVAAALQYSHEKGIIHRDVKPSNILLNKEREAFLTDFGIASVHETAVSLTGSSLLGTPAYMSPEQARGEKATEKSDQYSLGVVLYQMSTGELPFDGETPMVVVYKQIHEPLPTPRSVHPAIPPVMERVILKATAKRPKDRFDSMAELREVFRDALAYVLNPERAPEPRIRITAENAETLRVDESQKLPKRTAGPFWRRYPTYTILGAVLLIAASIAAVAIGMSLANRSSGGPGAGLPAAASEGVEDSAYQATIDAMALMISQGQDAYTAEELLGLAEASLQAQTGQPGAGGEDSNQGTPSPTPSGQATNGLTPTGAPTSTLPSQIISSPLPNPTATRTRTPKPTATSTSTSTATSTPTHTPTVTPTFTYTPSPTPNVCLTAGLSNFAIDGNVLRLAIRNDGGNAVNVTRFSFSWPRDNEALLEVKLGGSTIWQGSQTSPPLNVGISPPYSLGGGGSATMVFTFGETAEGSGYSVSVQLNGVCSVSGGL